MRFRRSTSEETSAEKKRRLKDLDIANDNRIKVNSVLERVMNQDEDEEDDVCFYEKGSLKRSMKHCSSRPSAKIRSLASGFVRIENLKKTVADVLNQKPTVPSKCRTIINSNSVGGSYQETPRMSMSSCFFKESFERTDTPTSPHSPPSSKVGLAHYIEESHWKDNEDEEGSGDSVYEDALSDEENFRGINDKETEENDLIFDLDE